MFRPSIRRVLAAVSVALLLAAIFYPFQPSLEQGILGPVGQMLFFYALIGWIFILLGVDPTGAGAAFAFFAPWPTLNVFLAVPLLFRPARQSWAWVRLAVVLLALFSPIAAWRLADAVSAIPLALWSASSIAAALAIVPRTQRPQYAAIS